MKSCSAWKPSPSERLLVSLRIALLFVFQEGLIDYEDLSASAALDENTLDNDLQGLYPGDQPR